MPARMKIRPTPGAIKLFKTPQTTNIIKPNERERNFFRNKPVDCLFLMKHPIPLKKRFESKKMIIKMNVGLPVTKLTSLNSS